ncbi:hypothetical protein C0991_006095 [Blastosporella zonata]|nr:hypothetical protein C0991_006095 [Blastosporella zonata]
MVEASSLGLAGSLTKEEKSLDLLYPRIERSTFFFFLLILNESGAHHDAVREISAHIAMEVIRAAQKAGVDRSTDLRAMNDAQLLKFVNGKMWNP